MYDVEYRAIIISLIAKMQRDGALPQDGDKAADEIQRLVADEMYISKSAIMDEFFC